MNFYKKPLIIIALAIVQIACGEISYKRGASVRDIETAHKACRGVPESAFSDCLQKQGWEVQKFDDSDLFAEVSVTDNRGTPPTKVGQSAFVEVQENAHTNSVVENKTIPANDTVQPDIGEVSKSNEMTTTKAKTSITEAKPADKPSPAPVDPLKTYKINSWWKFGGTPEHLKRDQNNCVATLGAAHLPDMTTQTYTRGLIECLHKNGWKALKAMK